MAGTVSVCISAFRHDGQLMKSLKCMERAACEVSVFVCDHSRNEAASEKFQWAYPELNVLFRNRKVRYSEAINSIPRDRLGKYLVIMDPGMTFNADMLSRMIAYMELHPAISVLSPLVTDQKGIEIPLPRKELTVRYLLSMLFGHSTGGLRKWYENMTMTDRIVTAPIPVQIASSRFMVIRSDAFSRLGGFNTAYDRFLADCDFCRRVLEAHAGSIVWHPDMPVIQLSSSEAVSERTFSKLISTIRYSLHWHIRW